MSTQRFQLEPYRGVPEYAPCAICGELVVQRPGNKRHSAYFINTWQSAKPPIPVLCHVWCFKNLEKQEK